MNPEQPAPPQALPPTPQQPAVPQMPAAQPVYQQPYAQPQVAAYAPQPGMPYGMAAPENHTGKHVFKIIAIVVAIFVALIVGFVIFIFAAVGNVTKGAQEVSDRFISDAKTSNSTDAATLVDSKDISSSDTAYILQVLHDDLGNGNTKIVGRSYSTRNNLKYAVIVYSFDDSNGKAHYARFILFDETAGWKIAGYKYSDTTLDFNVTLN